MRPVVTGLGVVLLVLAAAQLLTVALLLALLHAVDRLARATR
jgi:hypothetical protein